MTKTGLQIIALILLISCSKIETQILANNKLKFEYKYHCWPYDVKVYRIEDDIIMDTLLGTYPLDNYFDKSNKYEISKWKKYSDNDTTEWKGIEKTVKKCDDNKQLYSLMLDGKELYYSGLYQHYKVSGDHKTRKYEVLLILSIDNSQVHIFKDINKVH